ncbi:hypothetical protein [Streptomyces sp. NBC_01353]|nr:hypothetical protein [Streptomyces sp. NBC_01353]
MAVAAVAEARRRPAAPLARQATEENLEKELEEELEVELEEAVCV